MGETRIVDNRVFLLGLDELYRKAMKTHEQGELLTAARRVAAELEVSPVERPVEGYYAEHPLLTEYFLLVRALQDVDGERASEVASLAEYNRLTEVMSSPIFGEAQWTVERSGATRFLPVGRDALSRALLLLRPAWTVESLTAAARTAAFENDDVSLVGLAARAGDALVLAALRESVVLYALVPRYGSLLWLKSLRYVWQVDRELVDAAARFVSTFNALFGEELPAPEPALAELFWRAHDASAVLGRCARLGCDDSGLWYHWAICRLSNGERVVRDFWSPEVWTTERLRAHDGICNALPEPAT